MVKLPFCDSFEAFLFFSWYRSQALATFGPIGLEVILLAIERDSSILSSCCLRLDELKNNLLFWIHIRDGKFIYFCSETIESLVTVK